MKVHYCSHGCQKQGWKREHKDVCQRPSDMRTEEVCEAYVATCNAREWQAARSDDDVLMDPRQLKVALLCGVPRHRLAPLFVRRARRWLNEFDGAAFRAAMKKYCGYTCSDRYYRRVIENDNSAYLFQLVEHGSQAKTGAWRPPVPLPPRRTLPVDECVSRAQHSIEEMAELKRI